MSQPICPRCRKPLNALAAFCPNCGFDLSPQRNAPPPIPTRGAGPASAVAFLVIGGGVLVLLGIIGCLMFVAAPQATTTIISPNQITPPVMVPRVAFPSAPQITFPAPTLTIKDSAGNEITDPALRATIQQAIEKNPR
jgi:hypothetical protein